MMSSVAAGWRGEVVEDKAEGQSPMAASTALVNENLNGIVAVIERKISSYVRYLFGCVKYVSRASL